MAGRGKKYGEALKDRVIRHKVTTVLGIIVAVLSAAGTEMQKNKELYAYGTFMVGISSFLGAIGLILAKDEGAE